MRRWLFISLWVGCIGVLGANWVFLKLDSNPKVTNIRHIAANHVSNKSRINVQSARPLLPKTLSNSAKPIEQHQRVSQDGFAQLDVQLVGTVIGESASDSIAIIEDSRTHALSPYHIGEILQGWRLIEITRAQVTFSRNDQRQYVQLQGHTPENQTNELSSEQDNVYSGISPGQVITASQQPLEPSQIEEIKAAITSVSSTERIVQRQKVLASLKAQNPLRMLREAAMQPTFESGQLVGVKLASVPESGVLSKSGFEPGDVVKSVNGQPVSDPMLIIKLPVELLKADALQVQLERNGKPLTLTYRMQ